MTTAEIATYPGTPLEEYRPRILMAPEDAKALDDQLRACTLAVLQKDTDYGIIPGMGDKPTLLKPGAEKLIQWFGFGFTTDCTEIERGDDGRKEGVTYRCVITKELPDGRKVTVATCEGYAGYDEDRFYVPADRARAKAEERERYNAARYRRAVNPAKWANAAEYRAPWNTVIKMAQKRALVGAAIDATAAAGLFTQDLEDMAQPPAERDPYTPVPSAEGDAYAAGYRAAADEWENATPARPQQNGGSAPEDARPWADLAIEQAASFKTEAEGQKLWRDAATARRQGRCTRDEADHVQNLISARITDRRKQAAARILRPLAEDDPWRAKLDELSDDDEAAAALEEIRQLLAAGQMDETRAGRISRAVIALFPKAAVTAAREAGDGP